ncbi:MAG TPA: hypothetical protein VIF14_11935 [Alphaproteobacteria bacterium]
MPDFRLPLSGDVVQSINPWNWVFRPLGSQIGLVNITLGNAGDPELERRILDDVGTYGRQLGRIGDVLRILVDRLEPKDLTPAERRAIDALNGQLGEIDRIKAARRAERDAS